MEWPSLGQTQTTSVVRIPRPLKRNEPYETDKVLIDAMSAGYGLVYVGGYYGRMGKAGYVEFYSGKGVDDRVSEGVSIFSIKVKTWQEIYEFMALIVAVISLAIIALDTVTKFFIYLVRSLI